MPDGEDPREELPCDDDSEREEDTQRRSRRRRKKEERRKLESKRTDLRMERRVDTTHSGVVLSTLMMPATVAISRFTDAVISVEPPFRSWYFFHTAFKPKRQNYQ